MDLNIVEESDDYKRACREIDEAEDDEYELFMGQNKSDVCPHDGKPRNCPFPHCYIVGSDGDVACARHTGEIHVSGRHFSLWDLIARHKVKNYGNEGLCPYYDDVECNSPIFDKTHVRSCFFYVDVGGRPFGFVCLKICLKGRKVRGENLLGRLTRRKFLDPKGGRGF